MALYIIIFIGLAATAFLWKVGRLSSGALSAAGAGLALGLIGYAVQGSPALPSAEVVAKAEPKAQPVGTAARDELIGKFGAEADTLAQADAYFRIDRPDLAARVIRLSLEKNPKSPALWTGLGNAMVGHGRGLLSPAAEYSYKKALRLSPDYPGALYFYALALAQNDRLDDAKPVFRRLVLSLPMEAPMRKQLLADLIASGLLTAEDANASARSK